MATSLWELLGKYRVVIPIIQRDYAQGRQTGKIPIIRKKFLNALSSAIKNKEKPLELDFVYGYTSNESKFFPLDGQQRLTTLFLLHWFIAIKENKVNDCKDRLSKFTYETRHSSRIFCQELIKKFSPEELEVPVSCSIINQPWFFTAWKNDPTISAMLIMLDDIQKQFQEIDDVWSMLTSDNPQIVFHLLPIEGLGLPDDLYIKMNSRGKELTEFEYFKSRFSSEEILDSSQAITFNESIDQKWSDLFWGLYKDTDDIDIAKRVDNAFLRFFRYITDLLIAQNDISIKMDADEFVVYQQVYKGNEKNINFLFSCLDIFYSTYLTNPIFFDSVFYVIAEDFNEEKTRLFFQNPTTDLFKKCANNYDTTPRTNPFSIGEQLLLYACIIHLVNKTADFNSRLRKLRNLIANSEDTVRKENMKSLLATVSEIILNNKIDSDSKFSKAQAKEEESKQLFIQDKGTLKESIYKLEDHHLLQGCIAIFALSDDFDDYAVAFRDVFTKNCDYESVSRALLTCGDYSQQYNSRRRLGNHNDSVWREIFTPSQRRHDFSQTKTTLYSLLYNLINDTTSNLDTIIVNYLGKEEIAMDWKYYYIKYPDFRKWNTNFTDGYYYWEDKERSKQYEVIMMFKNQFNGRHWSPFLLSLKRLNKKFQLENYGSPLVIVKDNLSLRISNLNHGFKLEVSDDDSQRLLRNLQKSGDLNKDNVFLVKQNDEGIDIEDRVEKCFEFISKVQSIDMANI